jgi:hypothetical protein
MAPSPKLAKRFNPNKEHGTVHGDPRFAFNQNGIMYNGAGHAVDDDGKKIPMEAGPLLPQVQASPKAQQPKQRDIDDDDVTEDEKPLDLVAWRDGKLQGTLWPLVVAAVKAQIGKAPSSKVEALEMINTKLGPPPDAEPEPTEEA